MTSAGLIYSWITPERDPYPGTRLARVSTAPSAAYRTGLPTSESPPPYEQAIEGDPDAPTYEAAASPPQCSYFTHPRTTTTTGSTFPTIANVRMPSDYQSVAPQSKPSFTLNGKDITTPFITVKTVKAHLRLLACFAQLRKDVLANKQPDLEAAGITDEDRWCIFLVRAHHRFETWLSIRACEPETYDLPTADFLYIWYAYLVHPRIYFEDNGREAISRGFSVEHAASLVDPVTNKLAPPPITPEARARVEGVLGYNIDVNYDILPDPSINDLDHILPIMCPKCRQEHWVPYLSLKEPTSGYAHREFRLECRQCGMFINRERLCVARFALTVLMFFKQRIYLTGTQLHPATGKPDGFFAATLNNGMLAPFLHLCSDCQTFGDIGERLNWSMAVVERLLRDSPMGWPLPDRVTKILSCYSQPQFSLDLVAAAQRQTLFIEEVEAIGWLDPHKFDSDIGPLELAIARYHQYLDLVASESNMKNVLVPTLDINIVMQAHQTRAVDYRHLCHMTMSMLPDNNEKLLQKDLLSNYERTARLFKARFKQPYSSCGCERSAFASKVTTALTLPSKGATNLEDVLTVLAESEGRSTKTSSRDLPSLRVATHPCSHSMMYSPLSKKIRRSSKPSIIEGHSNTLLFPPGSWLAVLGASNGYGYTTADAQGSDTPSFEQLSRRITT